MRRENAKQEVEEARKAETARSIWMKAVPAAGSPVETYLASRGLQLPPEAPFRFHPSCPRRQERLPAMLAMMTDAVTGEPCGLHRTYLRPDGSGKANVSPAKMMLGAAGVIRLAPDDAVTNGLGICEGIENGLAIMQRVGWAPVWACGSAGGIGKLPVLAGIEALSIFADADDKGAGLAAARECAERWTAAGRHVTIHRPPAGTDWLDAMQGAPDA